MRAGFAPLRSAPQQRALRRCRRPLSSQVRVPNASRAALLPPPPFDLTDRSIDKTASVQALQKEMASQRKEAAEIKQDPPYAPSDEEEEEEVEEVEDRPAEDNDEQASSANSLLIARSIREAFVAVHADRDVLQQLEAAFQRVGAYAFPLILREEEVQLQVFSQCSGNASVFRAAFKQILKTMELIMAEGERQALEFGPVSGHSGKTTALRARSTGTGSSGLSAAAQTGNPPPVSTLLCASQTWHKGCPMAHQRRIKALLPNLFSASPPPPPPPPPLSSFQDCETAILLDSKGCPMAHQRHIKALLPNLFPPFPPLHKCPSLQVAEGIESLGGDHPRVGGSGGHAGRQDHQGQDEEEDAEQPGRHQQDHAGEWAPHRHGGRPHQGALPQHAWSQGGASGAGSARRHAGHAGIRRYRDLVSILIGIRLYRDLVSILIQDTTQSTLVHDRSRSMRGGCLITRGRECDAA